MPATTDDTPAAPLKPQGPSLEEAAERMEGLLDLREGNQGLTNGAAEDAPANTEGVAAEAEPQETGEEAPGEAQATETEEKPEGDSQQEPQMVTVTIDGKAETVPLEEALKGYQRHSDYSRKTAALANDRRKLDEQQTAVSSERQTYATMLVALKNQLEATQEQEPNWEEVYRSDPVGYARRRDEWRDKQDKIAAANFELQRVGQLQQQEHQQNVVKMVSEGRARMLDMMPEWRDQKVWESDRQKVVTYAQSVGYSPEEIAQAYDPRAVVAMHKARLWDELQAKKPVPVTRKGPTVVAAGAAQAVGDRPKLNAAQQRLAKSGSLDDAAKVFEQLI